MSTTDQHPRDLRDYYGRHYRVGERATDLTGHPRSWQAWVAWVALAAVSPLQYAFGITALGLQASPGWSPAATMWLFAVFVACQAGVALPVAFLHRGRIASPSQLVVTGGLLSTGGLLTLGNADSWLLALLGYSVVGGVGAGLVYATCISTAAKWFPDRRVSTIGFVTGGFACGAVPVVLALTLVTSRSGQGLVLDAAAALALVAVTLAGQLLSDPPSQWWPADIDAQLWAVDRHLNPSLPSNIPAMRSYAPREALRTGAMPLMWMILAMISGVSLLALAFVASFAVSAGLGLAVAGTSATLLAATSGLARSFAGRLSDRFGRAAALAAVLGLEGLALLGLTMFGDLSSALGYVVCAALAGVGGGAFYAILGTLVLEFFGENSVLQNQAIVYSAKAAGGVVGVGGAALVIAAAGYAPVFLVAGLVSLATAALVRFLKQPGRNVLADVAARRTVGTRTSWIGEA